MKNNLEAMSSTRWKSRASNSSQRMVEDLAFVCANLSVKLRAARRQRGRMHACFLQRGI